MINLEQISSFIEDQLLDKYLLRYNEIIFIGISRRNNATDGEHVIRFAIDGENSAFRNELQSDHQLRKLIGFEVVQKGRKGNEINLDLNLFASERRDCIQPGIPVTGISKGAISAIMFRSARPYILSNAHILGPKNTTVYQPDSFAVHPDLNEIGQVEDSDINLDCAISPLSRRDYIRSVVDLEITPSRSMPATIGDSVVKFGLRSGRTFGIVTTVKAIVKKPENQCVRCQFIIEPDLDRLPESLEISVSGDSGAPWVKTDSLGNPSDILLGIESGGDDSNIDANLKAEYAHATEMVSIQRSLKIEFN